MDYERLEDIGLTRSEAKVYLALIELGEATVGPITRKAKVASSKTYELLDKLMQKGLVTTYLSNNTNYYKAVHPRRLKDYIERKKNEIESQDAAVTKIIPVLEAKFLEHSKDTEVELFKSYRGVESIFNEMIDTLSKGDDFLVAGGGDSPTHNERTKAFFEKVHKKRSEKGVRLRIIFSEARRKANKSLMMFPHTSARYLPYGTPSTINIYKGVVFLLIMSPTPAAIRIKDKRIAESYRAYFEELWKSAKP